MTNNINSQERTMAWTYEVHELSEGFSAIVYDQYGQAIADHLSEDRAAMIAAAPEMYAALAETRLQLQYLADKFGGTGTGAAVLARVNAAIAKVEQAYQSPRESGVSQRR